MVSHSGAGKYSDWCAESETMCVHSSIIVATTLVMCRCANSENRWPGGGHSVSAMPTIGIPVIDTVASLRAAASADRLQRCVIDDVLADR